MLFRSNDTATTEIYTGEDTLSLHDALPIFPDGDYPVPGYWTSYPDLSLPPEGEATYRLRVEIRKKNRPLSLLIPEIFTEYRLFVNGDLMDRHGRFAEGRIRFLSPRIYTFHNDRDTPPDKDRKSTRLNSSHRSLSRMPSSA